MKPRTPHPMNVAGDFYVEDGCCTACTLPQTEAPDHFDWEYTESETNPGSKIAHCFICRQPSTNQEIERMSNAMHVQELDCIRYKGNDGAVIKFLKEHGNDEYIDDEV